MHAIKISVEPFEFLSFIELECRKELNQHGAIQITGLIHQENEQEYMNLAARETWVSVKVISETGEKRHFFDGILVGLKVKKEYQVSVLTIEVKTGTFLLDIEPHVRSFQDGGLRYADLVCTCMENVSGHCIMLDKENELTQRFLMQYNETDWEFIKRIASYAGTVIMPEETTYGKKFYFGYHEKTALSEIQSETYQMEQNCETYRKWAKEGVKDFTVADSVSYVLHTREIYSLGESVHFKGQDLVIGKITSWLKGQELYNEYQLISKENGLIPIMYNSKISGVSLKANVMAVEKTMVQVKIQEDENKENCKSCWLDYATVYSTPDGTGWYCMPEIGDEVRVVFPDKDENNVYVASSVHVGAAGGRTNPEEKSWKNKQNKEILFTPDSIIMRNNNGLVLEMSDQNGIKMSSNKDISVHADGDIQIRSKSAGVHMSAENNIIMQQGAAKIQMDETININGGKIYMN